MFNNTRTDDESWWWCCVFWLVMTYDGTPSVQLIYLDEIRLFNIDLNRFTIIVAFIHGM